MLHNANATIVELTEDVLEVAERVYITSGGETFDGDGQAFMEAFMEEWVSRSRFDKAVATPAPVSDASKSAVIRLNAGIKFIARIHHEQLHKDLIAKGQITYMQCDAKTCKYAREVEEWMIANPI
jgi:hypothetical protein